MITNGCQVSGKMIEINSDIREKYKISYEKKIMLCVGNIYPNKNQFQVVRAYSMLPESIKNKLVILFLGNDCTSGEINILIKEKMYIPVQTDPLFRRN